jgi:DNA (cytosine-5)-methyltransferase 1
VNESNSVPSHLSVKESALLLRISEQSVRAMLSKGDLNGDRVGRTWVVETESVHDLARARGLMQPSTAASKRSSKKYHLRALSFFSGAMGLDLGFERAGIETLLACEFDKWSRSTIEANKPDLPLLGDIWQHNAETVRLAAGLSPDEEIDIVAGGPPCQAFSTAGSRRGFEDERGNVFLHYVNLAIDLSPRYIVIENVRGLLSAPMKHRPHRLRGKKFPSLEEDEMPGGALAFVIFLLESAGYSVTFNLYNAANFGSPQTRERVILICARDGSAVPHLSPTHAEQPTGRLKPWRSFAEAVEGLEKTEHHHVNFPEDRLRYYRLLLPGQYWKHLPENLQIEALGNSYFSGGGKTGFLRRLAWDKPSPTIVTHPAMPATDLAHPVEDRPLSIEEYKRIQEFPDDWNLQGPLIQQYKQVGNAVPVSLGAALGKTLVAHSQGRSLPIPNGFKFSRYRNTDQLSWVEARRVAVSPNNQPKLF